MFTNFELFFSRKQYINTRNIAEHWEHISLIPALKMQVDMC